jgi:hypothetical protein
LGAVEINSILKFDRGEKSVPEDREYDDVPNEEGAA